MFESLESAGTVIVDVLAALMPLGLPFWGLIVLLAVGFAASFIVRGRSREKTSREDSGAEPADNWDEVGRNF